MALNIGELEAVLRLRDALANEAELIAVDLVPTSLIVVAALFTLAAHPRRYSRRQFFRFWAN